MPKMTTGKEKPKVVFTVQMAWHNHNLPFISSQTGVRLRTIQWLVHCFKEAGEATHYFSSLKVCALIFRQVATAKREKEKNTRPTRPWEVGQMQHLCCPQPNSCWSRNKREIVVSILTFLLACSLFGNVERAEGNKIWAVNLCLAHQMDNPPANGGNSHTVACSLQSMEGCQLAFQRHQNILPLWSSSIYCKKKYCWSCGIQPFCTTTVLGLMAGDHILVTKRKWESSWAWSINSTSASVKTLLHPLTLNWWHVTSPQHTLVLTGG